jgi:hypothetical protein
LIISLIIGHSFSNELAEELENVKRIKR